MKYDAKKAETAALLETANRMCAAARTAPKTRGNDRIVTLILTDADKDAVADEMDRLCEPLDYAFFTRDAGCVRAAGALVLIGCTDSPSGLDSGCRYCGFEDCESCTNAGGRCAFEHIDLGIAVGSAISVAADSRVDSRVFFSAGRAAKELGLLPQEVKTVLAVPISVSGKSPFFDRKPKK